jgi:hypothetical protein
MGIAGMWPEAATPSRRSEEFVRTTAVRVHGGYNRALAAAHERTSSGPLESRSLASEQGIPLN